MSEQTARVEDPADLDPDRVVVTKGSGSIHRPNSDDPDRPACVTRGGPWRRVRAGLVADHRDLCRHVECFGDGERGRAEGDKAKCPFCGRRVERLAEHIRKGEGRTCKTAENGGETR